MRLTKVEINGLEIGHFFLPYEPDEPDRVCRLATPPKEARSPPWQLSWWENASEIRYRTWRPETLEETHAAHAFLDAARERLATFPTLEELGPLRVRSAEENALLQAIRDDWNNDAPRLVYADWLQDRGDPRGEFIALDAAMAKANQELMAWDPALETRRLALLEDAHRWLAPLLATVLFPQAFNSRSLGVYFERGFFEHLSLDRLGQLPEHAEVVQAAAPLLRRVSFYSADLDISGVLSVPLMEQIEGLTFGKRARLTETDLLTMANSPHLRNLRELAFQTADLTFAAAHLLAESPNLNRLKSLTISRSDEEAGAWTILLRSPRLENLEAFQTYLRPPESAEMASLMEVLATKPALRSLEFSLLHHPGDALAPLVQPNVLPKLEHFTLSCFDAHAEAGELLAEAPWLGRLQSLVLHFDLPTAAAVRLIEELHSAPLEHLRLQLDDDATAFAALAASPGLQQVKRLDLRTSSLSAANLTLLGESPWLQNLKRLVLERTQLDSDAVKALIHGPNFQSLRQLIVDSNMVSPASHALLKDHFREGVY